MNCKDLNELADLYADGELPEEARARVERHLIQCPQCAYRVRSIEQTRALLRQAFPPIEPSPASWRVTSSKSCGRPQIRPAMMNGDGTTG